jgi:HlyD family secretion protein
MAALNKVGSFGLTEPEVGSGASGGLLVGLNVGSDMRLLTARGDRIEAKVTELRPLGEFAVWRAARAVGDHDIIDFLLRADPIAGTESLEPGMSVWIDRGAANP